MAAWKWYCIVAGGAKKRAVTKPVWRHAPRSTRTIYRGEAGLRQRDVSSKLGRMKALRWLSAAMPLAVSLVLSLSPVTAPVAAAPPEPIQAAASDDSVIVPDSGTETDNSHTAKTLQLPESPVQLFADITVRD